MKYALTLTVLAVALLASQGSIASDAPHSAPSAACSMDAGCDPSACPVPCGTPCPQGCGSNGETSQVVEAVH
jgi:hypothetical protein